MAGKSYSADYVPCIMFIGSHSVHSWDRVNFPTSRPPNKTDRLSNSCSYGWRQGSTHTYRVNVNAEENEVLTPTYT